MTGKPMTRPPMLVGLAFALISGVYGLFFIYPTLRDLGGIQKLMARETACLERLRILFPVQARAQALENIRFTGQLPLPEQVRLERQQLLGLPQTFSDLAQKHGMTLDSSSYDLNGLDPDSQVLRLTLALEGRLPDFRKMFIDLAGHPSFESAPALAILPGRDLARRFLLTLNIRIQKASA